MFYEFLSVYEHRFLEILLQQKYVSIREDLEQFRFKLNIIFRSLNTHAWSR